MDKKQKQKDEWERFERNVTIALNVLSAKKEKIYPTYVSKHNSNHEKQAVLLMISNKEICKWSKTLATQVRFKGREAKTEGHQAILEGRQLWHYLVVKNYQHY